MTAALVILYLYVAFMSIASTLISVLLSAPLCVGTPDKAVGVSEIISVSSCFVDIFEQIIISLFFNARIKHH